MSIEYAIGDIVLGDAAITAKIGTRYYPVPLPENPTLPAITYQQISQLNYSGHTGTSNLARTRLQLTLWGSKYTDLVSLRDVVKARLRDYRNTSGVRGLRIDRVIWSNDLAQIDPDTSRQQRFIDLEILHSTPD